MWRVGRFDRGRPAGIADPDVYIREGRRRLGHDAGADRRAKLITDATVRARVTPPPLRHPVNEPKPRRTNSG